MVVGIGSRVSEYQLKFKSELERRVKGKGQEPGARSQESGARRY
jgi:hypothetical protein